MLVSAIHKHESAIGIPGNISCKVKDRNGMDLTEAEDIKKRWQEYTDKLYRKDLHDPDSHDGVIAHLEPDILGCEVKWVSCAFFFAYCLSFS